MLCENFLQKTTQYEWQFLLLLVYYKISAPPLVCVLRSLFYLILIAFQITLSQYSRKNYSNGLPPNVREAGFGKVLVFLSPLVAVGGVIGYAKSVNIILK